MWNFWIAIFHIYCISDISFNFVIYIWVVGKTSFLRGLTAKSLGLLLTVHFCLPPFLIISPSLSLSFATSLYPPIPLPSSSVCRVSRSSLRRPLKKIWMSWFSPCWSTAAQRRWTRGSVSVLFFFFFFTLSYLSLSLSLFAMLWF